MECDAIVRETCTDHHCAPVGVRHTNDHAVRSLRHGCELSIEIAGIEYDEERNRDHGDDREGRLEPTGEDEHEVEGGNHTEDDRLTSVRPSKPGDGGKRTAALEVFDRHLGHELSASPGRGRGRR